MAAAASHSVRVRLGALSLGIPTRRLTGLMVHHMAALRLAVFHLAVRRLVLHRMEVLRSGILLMAMHLTVRRRIRIPDYLHPAKNARISSARSFGSSIAAKWPPRGITAHR